MLIIVFMIRTVTNIIPECQSKHKLTKIILSLIVGVKYENNTLII